jgi:hypothetical protein
MYTFPIMESKSHFLAHFIPGILLGSVVGMAFGSLLVATQIPHSAGVVDQTPAPTEITPTGATPIRPIPHENNLVTVQDAKTGFVLQYSADAELVDKPVVTEVACGTYLPPDGYTSWPVEPSSVTINQAAYQLYNVEGAAAGTTYTSPYYFTKSGNTCLEIHWTYAQVNCLNYDQGADRYACISKNSQISTDSDAVSSTFQFITN